MTTVNRTSIGAISVRSFVALAAAAVLSSCSGAAVGEGEGKPSKAPSSDADVMQPLDAPELTERENSYQLLRDQDSQFESYTDSQIDEIYSVTCQGFDDGLTVELVLGAAEPSFGAYGAGSAIAFAVMVECPEYQGDVDAFTSQYGGDQ